MKEKQAVDAKPIAIYFAVQVIVGFISTIVISKGFQMEEFEELMKIIKDYSVKLVK